MLIIKEKDMNYVLNQFNSFDKNLKFTIDIFQTVFQTFLILKFVQMKLVFIKNIPKLVNMYTLLSMQY